MWLWGSLLGLFVGASIHGWSGAFWGAVIGWLAGLLLVKQGKATEDTIKSSELEKQLAHTQKVLEDIHWRLDRLEKQSSLPPSPMAHAAMDASRPELKAPAPEVPVPSMETQGAAPAAEIQLLPPLIAPAIETPVAEKSSPPPHMMAAQSSFATPIAVATGSEAPGELFRPAPAPPRSPEPEGPGFIERMLEGNIVAKLGVVILFFGVGFLLKFAYDRNMFPPELRLLSVAAASGAMLFIGYRVLAQKPTYALVLIGGAMGLLYLDVYFALKTFNLINAPAGFVLFALLSLATMGLAVRLDARAVAALGLTGGFLAPVLAASGSGNHVLLFSYYLLLNLVVLATSWFKSWRELNLVGFVFTFAVALIWGRYSYQPEHFATIEPFLITFFLLYLAIPILFAQRQPPELKGIVDGTLVFGMPMSAAMLQAALTRGMDDNVLAWSAFGAALIYSALACALWKREKMRLLAEAHLALAVVFGTVAPYFAFRGYPTFAFWTLEGAAIFWMGCRQKSVLARVFALCLQLGAAGYFWWVTQDMDLLHPWWNDRVIGSGLIAGAALLTAWFMHRFKATITAIEASVEGWTIVWGGAWLLFGIAIGTWQEWSGDAARLSALLFFMLTGFTLFEWLGARLDWRLLRLTSRAHVLLIGAVALLWVGQMPTSHPLRDFGFIAWPMTFPAYFYVLHRQRRDQIEAASGWRYTVAWILMVSLATWEAVWRYDNREFGCVFAIGVAGLFASALRFRLREFALIQAGEGATPLQFSTLPLWWSLIWWFAGLHGGIEAHVASPHHLDLHLTAAALSILLFEVAGQQLAWTALRRTQMLLTALMLAGALHLAGHAINPFRDAQFLAWLTAFAIGDFVLFRQEREDIAVSASVQHVLLFALALWLVGSDTVWRAEDADLSLSWQYAAIGFTVAMGLAMATFGIVRQAWPFSAHAAAFRAWAIMPLLVFALIWTLFANSLCDGTALPLPFVPMVNPLDLAQLALFAAGVWTLNQKPGNTPQAEEFVRILWLMFAGAAFLWVNAALLRTIHHWGDVPFELHALLHSRVAQAALSLLWTITALVLMMAAGRRQSRPLWMLGAALLGMVVLKLFVNDIGTSGTERVVSFIGVGLLLMVIGYVAPVPPRRSLVNKGKAGEGEAP